MLETAAPEVKLCSPTWRTELAYKEEAGLAPMFRSLLDVIHFPLLRNWVARDHKEGTPILETPRIKTGRCVSDHAPHGHVPF